MACLHPSSVATVVHNSHLVLYFSRNLAPIMAIRARKARVSTSSSSSAQHVRRRPPAVEGNAGLSTLAGDDAGGNAGLPIPAGDDAGLSTPGIDQPPAHDGDDEPYTPVKRTRYNKTGSADFSMQDRLCFKGGFLQKESILPTVYFGDDRMMKVSGREDWLVSSATGKAERRGPFEKATWNVKRDIIVAIALAGKEARGGKMKAAAAGRNQLDLPDSSDSSSASGEEDDGKQLEKDDTPLDGLVYTIVWRGLKFKAVTAKRLLYVETRADVAKTIVDACLEASIAVIKEETKQEVEGPHPASLEDTVLGQDDAPDGSKEPDQARVANPKGKSIRFDATRCCYEIQYVEKPKGPLRRSIKGLKVTKTKGKAALSPLETEENMARAFKNAKVLWNDLDKSDLPRYE